MKLPPLNSLRAFEAAARLGSFAKAADEMYVSPAAISRHVKKLEQHLSLTLFDRKAQGLMLTEVGRQLLPELTEAFQRISGAATRAGTSRNELRVLVGPTLGARWLMPRLPQFQELHPSIRVSAGVSVNCEQMFEAACDVGVIEGWRLNLTAPEDSEMKLLRYERMTPLCAPSLAKQSPRLRKPSDLRGKPLLHAFDTQDWEAWLTAIGETSVAFEGGTVYHTSEAAARAAIAGKGVAMLDIDLYKYELDSGQLVAPLEFVLDDASAVASVCSRQRLAEPAIGLFLDWLETSMRH